MKSLGMLELNSIARGIECCDVMLKAASVQLVKASTFCPGKYLVLIQGDTGSVRAALEAGKQAAGECAVDHLELVNIHPQLVSALMGTAQIASGDAIGAIEYYSVASAIIAADTCAKAANVTLIEVKMGYAIGGKGVVTLTGSVGDVRAAVAAAQKENGAGLLIGSVVIPKPAPELFRSLL